MAYTPSITVSRKTLSDFVRDTDGRRDFKVASNLFTTAERQPTDEECINGFKEDLTVEMMYSNDNIIGTTTLFRNIRDKLVRKDLQYTSLADTNN